MSRARWVATRKWAFPTVLLLVLGMSACSSSVGVERLAQPGGGGPVTLVAPEDRQPAPAFSGPLLGGGSFHLSDERGHVVLLNVWGSWCVPCREEAPELQAVWEDFRDRGVRFIGINTRDTAEGAAQFVEEFGITYPSVEDTDGTRLLAFRDTIPPAAIPTTVVVDAEGRIAASVVGKVTEQTLRDLLSDVLRSTPSTRRSAKTPA